MSVANNEKQAPVGIQAIRPRPASTIRDIEQASIWTTTHHLEAAAEASAEVSVSIQEPCVPEVASPDVRAAADTLKARAAKNINPAHALALLIIDLAARLFCLTVFWMTLIFAIAVSNVALCVALMHRQKLSVEVSLGITVGFDVALAAACLAFMARQFSTDIVRWAFQTLQPGEEQMQGHGKPRGSKLRGLHLSELWNKVQNQAEWMLAKGEKKMRGRSSRASSTAGIPRLGADAGVLDVVEEGSIDTSADMVGEAHAERDKRVSLSGLVAEVQRFISVLVKADPDTGRKVAAA